MTTSARRLLTDPPPDRDPLAVEAWQPMLSTLQRSLPEQAYHTWFEPLVPRAIQDDTLVLEVPSRFYYEWIEGHYAPLLDDVIGTHLGDAGRLQYALTNGDTPPQPSGAPTDSGPSSDTVALPDEPGTTTAEPAPAAKQPPRRNGFPKIDLDHGLNDRYTFATFIEGPPNQFARAAALAVADSPGTTSYNPLLIYGGVGLGKTHLLQAIGHAALARDPGMVIRFISSERFTQEFVEAIKANKGDQFSARYRKVDLLLMDDVQFLVGRDRTLLEFFHIFNALYQAGKQIVLSSDKPPRELQGLDERLVSRFGWGLVCDIGPPDFDTRVAILQTLSEQEGVRLPEDVIEFLAGRFTKNVREMQGAVIRLVAHASLTGGDLTLDLARQALRDLVNVKEQRIGVDVVQRVVAAHYGVAPDLLLAKVRTQDIARTRMIAMALTLRLCHLSLKQVGAQFGGRDHTTVLHARQKVADWEENDPDFAGELAELIRRIQQAED